MPQYLKLRKKVAAGARFVVNQIGWDTRKDDELLRWIRREQLPVSAIANVYVLSRTAARAFHRGQIPGVVVTDELLALAERHGAGPDGGRSFFVDLAAKQLAVARGLGFEGVYLGGHMPAATFGEILDRAGTFAATTGGSSRARCSSRSPDEFYFFERDAETGLSLGRGERGVPRVEAAAADRPARAAEVPGQPATPRGRLRAATRRSSRRARTLRGDRARAGRGREGRARARAGGEGAAVRLPGLRRLLAARHRLRLPGVALRQEPAQRPLRRHARRPLRGLRLRVHLVAGLRAAEGLRRGGDDARRRRGRQGQRARRGRARGRTPSSAATTTHARARADGRRTDRVARGAASHRAWIHSEEPLGIGQRDAANTWVRVAARTFASCPQRVRADMPPLCATSNRGSSGDP